jgi:hypothetical protein
LPVDPRSDHRAQRKEEDRPALAQLRRRTVVPASQESAVDLADERASAGQLLLRDLDIVDLRSAHEGIAVDVHSVLVPVGLMVAAFVFDHDLPPPVDEITHHLDVRADVDRDIDLGMGQTREVENRPGLRLLQ